MTECTNEVKLKYLQDHGVNFFSESVLTACLLSAHIREATALIESGHEISVDDSLIAVVYPELFQVLKLIIPKRNRPGYFTIYRTPIHAAAAFGTVDSLIAMM